jgi:threonylcarbamoyladenosine tRNA methylthiotransferase MtaB
MMKRVAFHTLGCKVNQYESEKLMEKFAALGFDVVPETEMADVYVINSCTVTSIADKKSRNFARRAKRLNPNSLVALIGCYAETSANELSEIAEIDLLLGSAEKDKLPEKICEILGAGLAENYTPGVPRELSDRTRAYLKIEDGCDRLCAYCIIPHARGPVRSRPATELIDEAASLIDRGYKEIILTGINAALYADGNADLIALTKSIAALPGDFRLRLSSLEPTVIDAEYAKRLAGTDKLCPHLHLSLQSGSNAVLAAMGRRYTIDDYAKIISVLKERDPLFGLTTDIIVGFPNETNEDFCRSAEAVREFGFSHVHVFRYSKRPGTKAAEMPNQISDCIKKMRSDRLTAEAEKISAAYRNKCRGTVRRALILAPDSRRTGFMRALTDIGIETEIPGSVSLTNTFTDVRL